MDQRATLRPSRLAFFQADDFMMWCSSGAAERGGPLLRFRAHSPLLEGQRRSVLLQAITEPPCLPRASSRDPDRPLRVTPRALCPHPDAALRAPCRSWPACPRGGAPVRQGMRRSLDGSRARHASGSGGRSARTARSDAGHGALPPEAVTTLAPPCCAAYPPKRMDRRTNVPWVIGQVAR